MTWVDPRTWLAGEKLSASKLQTIRDSLKAIGDAWSAYTPAWSSTGTAPVIGNGTISGQYIQAGKLVIGEFSILMGSTTTFGTGTYSVTVPVAIGGPTILKPAGIGIALDGSTFYHRVLHSVGSATVVTLSDDDGTRVSGTVPFTFATADRITGSFYYQAA